MCVFFSRKRIARRTEDRILAIMKRGWSCLGFAILLMPALAARAHSDALPSVAQKLAKGLASASVKRIAVVPLSYPNDERSSGSTIIAERLTTELVGLPGVEVVERALLDQALGEIQLGLTGAIDQATTQKLGKLLGVSAIVTGTLNDVSDTRTEVNARLIETETGKILAASSARVRRTWTDRPRPQPPQARKGSDEYSGLHASKAIPVSTNRQKTRLPPAVPQPPAPARPRPSDDDNVLALGHDDLIALHYNGETRPERIVEGFLTEQGKPSPDSVRMARRIYHSHPDPKVRGRALLSLGHLYERSGRPKEAAVAYRQILEEFPQAPELQAEARARLSK